MAHRIVKKAHGRLQPQGQETPNSETQNYYANQVHESAGQNKLARPTLPSVNAIYTHEKNSFRKNMLGFPPPESLFTSQNNYDAGPHFLRPTSALTLGNPKKTNFPLGVWVNPFGSDQVPKINVGSPLRCTRCHAYANCYFKFDGNKSSAICNICTMNFGIETGTIEKCNLNSTELTTEGVVDFVLQDRTSMKKNANVIKILLAVEINSFMIESNAFTTAINSIKAAIQNIQFQKNLKIGIIVFNANGIIYLKLNKSDNWNKKLPKRYLVRYTNQGLCCPLSDNQMLFNPETEKQQLGYLLDCVNDMAEEQYKNNKHLLTHGANYALLLKSIMQSFDQEVGRVMLFTGTAPRTGPLALRARNQEDNKNPLRPLTADYFQLSKQLITQGVGVDMYVIGKQALVSQQLATTHFIATHTGGNVYLYCPFLPENHAQSLYYQVYGALERRYVYDVHFTARFSNGLNLVSFGIGDGIHETRDIGLGIFDPQNSVSVNFEQEEKIEENNAAFIQFAMIFTNGSGERVIRVLNYRYQISNKIEAIHCACDYLAVANIILRQTISKMMKGDPLKVREELINKLVGIVTEYAQEVGSISRNSAFMAHPNLIPAFAYIHSFINSKVFLNYLKQPTDYRVYDMLKVNTINFISFSNTFYPKLFSLGMEIYEGSPVPGDLIQGNDDIEQSVVLPPSLPLSAESISKNGVYLCWLADRLLILVQPEAGSELVNEIFGTDDWNEIQSMNALPQLQSSHNIRINLMLEQLRRRTARANGIYLPLLIRTVKNKGTLNESVNSILKEQYQECKYLTFMDGIHRDVQGRLK